MKNNSSRFLYHVFVFLCIIAVVLILLTLWVSFNDKIPFLDIFNRENEVESNDDIINSVNPHYGNIQSFISINGFVQPQNRVEIKPSISGRIESMLVKEGDTVKLGDTLAWMSSTDRAALLDAARSKGEKALKYWEQVYKPTPLISPINGKVIARSFESGQTVSPADTVLVLSDRLIVRAKVDETDAAKVKVGQPAIINLDAYPQIKVNAKVGHISFESTVVDGVTVYMIEIIPSNVPDVFRAGMSAVVNIIEKNRENVLLIPLDVVKQEKEESYVLLLGMNDKKPIRQMIKTGISDEKNIEILSGLTIDDKVIIDTPQFIQLKNKNRDSNSHETETKKTK